MWGLLALLVTVRGFANEEQMTKIKDTLSNESENKYWKEDGKSWYQYIHSDEIIRQNDENYSGKHFRHKRCPFCNRITCLATLHWYNHLEKCAPPEYSMADIGELRYRKPNELRGERIGR